MPEPPSPEAAERERPSEPRAIAFTGGRVAPRGGRATRHRRHRRHRRHAATSALERLAIVVCALALAVGLIALMSGFFAGRDSASLADGGTSMLGQVFPNQGAARLPPGQPPPAYDSDPPTSGPHHPVPVTADQQAISNDQLLTALAAGDVVVIYGTPAPPPGLPALAQAVGGAFSPSLAAGGQAVVLARRPGTVGLVGLAWTRMVHVSGPDDPLLRAFAEELLGRGASR